MEPTAIDACAVQRAVADVGAVLHAVEADRRDGRVRGALRLAQRIAQRGDAEHAAAVHPHLRAVRHGAGVEHRDVGMRLRRHAIEPVDDIAPARLRRDSRRPRARPSTRRADPIRLRRDRACRRCACIDERRRDRSVRRAMIGCVSGSPRRQLNSSTRGAPFASIITPAYRNPWYGVPSAAMPAIAGRDHLAHDARMHRRRDDRRRRIGAHAARVGAAVAIAEPLVILARRERQRVRAVGHHDEARLLAVEEVLDDDARAGRAHARCRPASRRSPHALRLRRVATTTPLPAASPSALTTIGAPRAAT